MDKTTPCILLVEDEELHADLVRRAFEAYPHRFHLAVAGSLKEARAYLAKTQPDLVIADLRLADGQGTDLLPTEGEGHRFPLVVMTSHGDEQVAVESMKAGALDYFVKSAEVMADTPHIAERAMREWANITERKQAEEALRESEEQYRDLVENTSELIQSVAPDGSILFVNRRWRETLGYAEDEIRGLSLFSIIHPDSREHCAENFRHVMAGESLDRIEALFVGKDGRTITVEGSSSCLFKDGVPIATRGVFRDITERKRAEERVRQANRLAVAGQLAAGVAHEVNNPLSIIQGFAQLLLGQELDEPVRQDVLTIYEESRRAANVVQDLVSFAAPRELDKKESSAAEPLEKALALKAPDYRANSIDSEIDIGDDVPRIIADQNQLVQVYINILTNAQQALTENPGIKKLNISCRRAGDNVRLSFVDNGPGISSEHLEHIFEPFFTNSKSGGGTGLGLSVSHGIISAHGGRLWAESELGKGAAFHIELPGLIAH